MDQQTPLERINHFIDRAEARKLITAYNDLRDELVNPKFERIQKEFGILPASEAFNQKSILSILAQEGCVGIRIHYGIKYKQEGDQSIPLIAAVLVGVASDGSNMWGWSAMTEPAQTSVRMSVAARGDGDEGVIVEDSQRCPPFSDPNPMP